MSNLPGWLGDLILLEDYNGNWQQYEDAVYARFNSDFIVSRPVFEGLPVHITKNLIRGKERGFWHCIQEGRVEEDRTPDLRRCERIGWIRSVMENANDPKIRTWSNERKGKTRRVLWFEDAEFLVVLEPRRSCWMLLTAYPVTLQRRKTKLLAEFTQTRKKPTPPE